MADIVIQSHRGPYTVRFDRAFAGLESDLSDKEHMIIDDRVAELYAGVLKRVLASGSVLRLEAAESSKSLERFPAYVEHLLHHGIKRDHTLVAVGGGIIQDITAFLAATLLRGLPWRYYPTTLLAQADSCIGSKSSVNVGRYKNQLGTFTPPGEVLIAVEVLDSLSDTDLRSGLGEMIKVHIISGWEAVRAIASDHPKILRDKKVMEHYIRRSLEIKKAIIEKDEFDRNERLVMNYGHSFGHAIESATNYTIPHGIAVTMGMDMANYVSLRFRLIGAAPYEEIHALLALNYAGFERTCIPEDRFFDALARDKKNLGADLSLILARGPGQVFRGRYPNDERLRSACRDYFSSLRERPVAREFAS